MLQENESLCNSKKGWLLKWTNFVKGYRRRWFILEEGTLSYYRENSELAQHLRGTINLLNALIHSYNSTAFVISRCDSKEVFYLKASNSIDRQSWVVAIELEKLWAINEFEKDNSATHLFSDYNTYSKEIIINLTALGNAIEKIHKSNTAVSQCGVNLKKKLPEYKLAVESNRRTSGVTLNLQENLKLFQMNSNAMYEDCKLFIGLVENHYQLSILVLEVETNNRNSLRLLIMQIDALLLLLEKIVLNNYKSLFPELQQLSLENSQRSSCSTHRSKTIQVDKIILESTTGHRLSQITGDMDDLSDAETPSEQLLLPVELYNRESNVGPSYLSYASQASKSNLRKRRTRVPDRPNYSLNLWSVMKTTIGKDLSKIPMPVHFSEPLSFLQRVAEDFAYADVLDKAAECVNPLEEMAYLAAFTISCYSTTANRTGKPFNPLLGETFEWDRSRDLGWRLITEQVSHHPPIAAQYCEGINWTCWQEFAMTSKFRGKYVLVIPLGISHIIFHKSKNHYTWHKVSTTVNNIILGKLWVDNTGEMDIINHSNSSKCHIQFFPYSMFKPEEQRKISGEVLDSKNEVRWIIKGKWDTEITIAPVLSKSGKVNHVEYKTGTPIRAWHVNPLPEDCHKYYHFSEFACQLNEMEEGIAPTDSRHRPDQRLMEEGKWDAANNIKTLLEEKQRSARKKLTERASVTTTSTDRGSMEIITGHVYEPRWFKTEVDSISGRVTYVYNGGYWEAKEKQAWENCPDIFLGNDSQR